MLKKLLLLGMVLSAATACTAPVHSAPASSQAAAALPSPGRLYLALGDSLAYGMQIGKMRRQIDTQSVSAAAFNSGYVDSLAAQLQRLEPGLQVTNLGCPGETSHSFMAGPCAFATQGRPFAERPLPLHHAYAGAQREAALDYLRAHAEQVSLISLDLGINDLRAAQATCIASEAPDACLARQVPGLLARVRANLDSSLASLHAAAPKARILVLDYYNWFATPDTAIDLAIQALNRTIAEAARAHGARLVDLYAAFNRSGDASAQICALTLFCGPTHDLHPSDAGYRLIGTLAFAAYEQ
jgi:lysophospholipase L1-like esterase